MSITYNIMSQEKLAMYQSQVWMAGVTDDIKILKRKTTQPP